MDFYACFYTIPHSPTPRRTMRLPSLTPLAVERMGTGRSVPRDFDIMNVLFPVGNVQWSSTRHMQQGSMRDTLSKDRALARL